MPEGYNRLGGCDFCKGILSHEKWCPILNKAPTKEQPPREISIEDELILHALGVTWEEPKKGGVK